MLDKKCHAKPVMTPGTRSHASALFIEYYTYQARGEPKFILQPADGQWYENLWQEAEAFWANPGNKDFIGNF
jgi:hypothetical protein